VASDVANALSVFFVIIDAMVKVNEFSLITHVQGDSFTLSVSGTF